MKKMPSEIVMSFRNGKNSVVSAGVCAVVKISVATPNPASDSQKYFCLAGRPFGFLCLILMKSSAKPTAPKASVTSSANQTKRLVRSAHSRVDTLIAQRISTPPMVGVPVFFRCEAGPSSRTGWPNLKRYSRSIIQGPKANENSSAVRIPSTARIVRYPKRLKPLT